MKKDAQNQGGKHPKSDTLGVIVKDHIDSIPHHDKDPFKSMLLAIKNKKAPTKGTKRPWYQRIASTLW